MKARIAKKILKYQDKLSYGEHQIAKAKSVLKNLDRNAAHKAAKATKA